MSSSIRLNITEPCHENWQQMTPENDGRYCMACQKTVIDFSGMSDKEILKHIRTANNSVCGHFANDQLNKEIPLEEKKKLPFWVYTWNMVVATFLMASNANGQSKEEIKIKVQQEVPANDVGMLKGKVCLVPVPAVITAGVVLDKETLLPVGYASVEVKGRTIYNTVADSAGWFKLKDAGDSVIRISAIGYKLKDIVVSKGGTGNVIYLEPEAVLMGDVTVLGYPSTTKSYTVGGVGVVTTVSRYTKMVREIKEYLPKKDVQIYPNPAKAGSSVSILLFLKEAGKYSMEVFSTDGRLIYVHPVIMDENPKTIGLTVGGAWAKGNYWIRISGAHTKKVYYGKLLVQ